MTGFCRLCNGPLRVLVAWGVVVHFRCRDCGMDWLCNRSDVDIEEEEVD